MMNSLVGPDELAACNAAADRIARTCKIGAYWDGKQATNKSVTTLWTELVAALDQLGVSHAHLDHYLDDDQRRSGINIPRTRWYTTEHEDGRIAGRWAETPQESAIDCAASFGSPVVAVYDDENGAWAAQMFQRAQRIAKGAVVEQVALW